MKGEGFAKREPKHNCTRQAKQLPIRKSKKQIGKEGKETRQTTKSVKGPCVTWLTKLSSWLKISSTKVSSSLLRRFDP
jgi:hypothetical protein